MNAGIPQRIARRDPARGNTTVPRRPLGTANSLTAWLALIGLILPAIEVQIYIAGAKLTAGRVGIFLLFLPALFRLGERGRRFLLADVFAFLTTAWIVGAPLYTGEGSLASAAVEGFEFIGGYLVARAFFIGPPALHKFINVLKTLAFTSIIFAILDRISGRMIVHETFASIFHTSAVPVQLRDGLVRATSTFDHAILFGAFCVLVGTILLYNEQSVSRRMGYFGFCFLGCLLSLSSSALISCFIVLSTYAYGKLLRRYPWRWVPLWTVIVVFVFVIILTFDDPLGFFISHLTLEPQSGYWRLMTWDAALKKISQSPLTGHGIKLFGEFMLDLSVDTVWLTLALRFGIPSIVFLFLTNVSTFLPSRQLCQNRATDSYEDRMRTAFTLVLIIFMFIGVTVHIWNFLWIFWGLCLGIRASLRERSIGVASQSISYSRPPPIQRSLTRAAVW